MSEKQELTVEERMTVEFEIDGRPIKLSPNIVRDFITGGTPLTNAEYKMFVELCQVRKLNPFLKEVHAIKFGSAPVTIVVGKDAILKRAVLHPEYDGKKHGVIVLTADGEEKRRTGTFHLSTETLVGGWAEVYRKDITHPTEISVMFEEVAQKKRDGNLNSNWATKGATMVEKVAVVRALRETFVEEFGGMIDEDEAWDVKPTDRTNTDEVVDQVIDVEATINEEDVIEVEI